MWRWIGVAVGGVLTLGVVLWLLLVVTLRARIPFVLNAIRRFNRAVVNPRAMRTAGRPGAYAGVVRHVGRSTGTSFETPVGVVETDEGLVIALPYGTSPDWLKNVRAAGSASVHTEGRVVPVTGPELVPREAVGHHFPAKERRSHRLYGVDQFLLLRKVGPDSAMTQRP